MNDCEEIDRDTFKVNLIFTVYSYFVVWNVSRSKRLMNLRNHFLAKCGLSVSSIRSLRVILANCEFESPPCLSVFSQYAAWLEAFTDTCALTGCRKKKETSVQSKYYMSKELRKNFLFASGSPSFQGCADCASYQKPPTWEIVIFVFNYSISCCFFFIFIFMFMQSFFFFVWFFFLISYLISTNQINELLNAVFSLTNSSTKWTTRRTQLSDDRTKTKPHFLSLKLT